MAFKFVVFAAAIAVACASHNEYLAPLALGAHNSISTYSTHQQHAPAVKAYATPVLHALAAPAIHTYAAHAPVLAAHEPSAPAHYDYGYGVSDPLTGDHHSQQESRRGDAVRGSYSLIEADGSKRTVDYAADDHTGFNAVVHKEPAAAHVAYAAQAPIVHARLAAPSLVHGYAAPSLVQGYSAPSLVQGYSAHAVAAPSLVQGYSAHAVAAPSLVQGYSAHAVSNPSLVQGYSAHAVAAPALVQGYAAAPALAHGYSPLVASHGLSHNVW